MTKSEIKKAISTGSTIYLMDYNGVESIDFSDKRFEYTFNDVYMYKLKDDIKVDYYRLNNLYEDEDEAQENFEELGL